MSAWHYHESVPHLRNPIKQTGNLCPAVVSNPWVCRCTKCFAFRKQDANITPSKTVVVSSRADDETSFRASPSPLSCSLLCSASPQLVHILLQTGAAPSSRFHRLVALDCQ